MKVECVISNPVAREKSARVKLEVSSARMDTCVPRAALEGLSLRVEKRRGQNDIAYAVISAFNRETIDEIEIGNKGLSILGGRSLDGLRLKFDAVRRRLVDAGPSPVAATEGSYSEANGFENSVYALRPARFSEDKKYRYSLSSEIRNPAGNKQLVVFQLNPSKAGNECSDPTVGKVSHWAAQRGFRTVHFLNLFAFVETVQANISDLEYDELVGAKTDEAISELLRDLNLEKGTYVVFGFGRPRGVLAKHVPDRVTALRARLEELGVKELWHVGKLTLSGHPRHGRGWNKDTELELLHSERDCN